MKKFRKESQKQSGKRSGKESLEQSNEIPEAIFEVIPEKIQNECPKESLNKTREDQIGNPERNPGKPRQNHGTPTNFQIYSRRNPWPSPERIPEGISGQIPKENSGKIIWGIPYRIPKGSQEKSLKEFRESLKKKTGNQLIKSQLESQKNLGNNLCENNP